MLDHQGDEKSAEGVVEGQEEDHRREAAEDREVAARGADDDAYSPRGDEHGEQRQLHVLHPQGCLLRWRRAARLSNAPLLHNLLEVDAREAGEHARDEHLGEAQQHVLHLRVGHRGLLALLGVGQLDDGDAAPHDGDGKPLHSLELLLQQQHGHQRHDEGLALVRHLPDRRGQVGGGDLQEPVL